MTQLQLQLFVGFYKPKFLKPVKSKAWVNPEGGLWTSTFNKKTGSDWLLWQKDEQWYKSGCKTGSLLKPNKNIRVYTINTLDDLKECIRKYPQYSEPPSKSSSFLYQLSKTLKEEYIDYGLMGKDYDALHLTEEGQWATRLTHPNLYGWDCETVFWFNPTFTVKKEITLKNKWFTVDKV